MSRRGFSLHETVVFIVVLSTLISLVGQLASGLLRPPAQLATNQQRVSVAHFCDQLRYAVRTAGWRDDGVDLYLGDQAFRPSDAGLVWGDGLALPDAQARVRVDGPVLEVVIIPADGLERVLCFSVKEERRE
ncbi:MAG: hypothetical protein PF961_21070 [Planctomycetota bacterium]|jgi:hypothetical protein|nr:hypothetical protein [Planctomycetota bacterium]